MAQIPKQTATEETRKIRGRGGKTVSVITRLEEIPCCFFELLTLIKTSVFNSGAVSVLSGYVEAITLRNMFSSIIISCNSGSVHL